VAGLEPDRHERPPGHPDRARHGGDIARRGHRYPRLVHVQHATRAVEGRVLEFPAVDSFATAWDALDPAPRRALELAYESLVVGGLPVGGVLADAGGAIVAEGRNRAYDPRGGPDALQGTPLAHAELNVLAAVPTDRDLGPDTLWSTHEPCSMCAAAADFTGVGTVRYVAPDPWAVAAAPAPTAAGARAVPLGDPRWAAVAGVLFVLGVAARVGVGSPTVTGNPEVARIALDLLPAPTGGTLEELIAPVWPRVLDVQLRL
jgi:tRNA(Arg) A34 adenosine deaminase TadA